MENPRNGRLALPTQMFAITGALLLVGGCGAQRRVDQDQDPMRVFEQEQAQIQTHIEKRMRALERKIKALKVRLEKERLEIGKAGGKQGKVIERSSMSEIQMRMGKDGVRIEIQEKGSDGKLKKRVYKDKDLGSLLRAHPELKKKFAMGGGMGIPGLRGGLVLPGIPNFHFDFGGNLGPKGGGFGFSNGIPMGADQLKNYMREYMRQMFSQGFWGGANAPKGSPNPRPWKKLRRLVPTPPAPPKPLNAGPVFVFKDGPRVRVEIRTPNGRRAFEGKSIEEIIKKHPELKGVLKKGKQKGLQQEFEKAGKLRSLRRPAPSNDGPKLGIYLKQDGLNPALRQYLDIPEGAGIWVMDVVRGSLAARMGMRKKDILLRLNGKLIKGARDVAKVLGGLEDDAPVKAEVLRRGREVVLKARR